MASRENRHYFKEMRLQQFRSFCEIARQKSFAGAAESLEMSRSAVWQQIRALEREFNASFVRRKGRGAELTDDGLLLLELATPLVSGFESIRQTFEDRQRDALRRLVVVTGASVLANELKKPIKRFVQDHPRVQLALIDRTSAQAVTLLENGEADMAIVGQLDDTPRNAILEYEMLATYPFMLACSRNHELAGRKKIRIEMLVRYPLVLMSQDSVTRRRVEQVFQKHGLADRMNVILESTNDDLIFDYVSQGVGITLMPMSPEHLTARRVHTRSVRHWFGVEHCFLVQPSSAHRPSHIAEFNSIVRSTFRRINE